MTNNAFLVLALTCGALAGRAASSLEPPPRPALRWVVAQRDLDFGSWRCRLAGRPAGEVWIGGGPASEAATGDLYRLDGEEWRLAHTLGVPRARTFVLDVDPRGRLWVVPYAEDERVTYARLEVRHLDRGIWRSETLRPGLWPQAMAWPKAEEGWIAGNNGLFYHRRNGRWSLETLDLAPAERQGLNTLALHVSARGEVWAVGTRGLVARHTGAGWRRLPVPAAFAVERLGAVDSTADGSLWIAGTHGLLARRDGTDGRWTVWRSPGEPQLLGLAMTGPDDGWAVGGGGTILRFDGKAWRAQPSPTREPLTDVRMTSPEEGWIVGGPVVLRATRQEAPRFWDRSATFPAFASRGASQLAAVDADGDGDLDLFTAGLEGIHRYENRGRGDLADRGGLAGAGLGEISPDGAAWGDADGDGRLDLLVVGWRPSGLWLQRQRRGFELDPPAPLPLGPPGGLHDLPSLVDANGDGYVDLHLARSSPYADSRMADLLYAGNGAGGWRRVTGATGDRGTERLALWGDVDGDLDLDLVLAASGRQLDLWRNDRGRFQRATLASGLDFPFGPGAMNQGALWDLDRDGDLDLLLLGDRLYAFRNDGRGRFAPVPDWFEPLENSPSLAPSQIAIGDLDLDGWPEVLLTPVAGGRARVALLSRGPDGRYRDRAAAAGVRDLAGQAAAFADWDGDGDLDLLVSGARRSYLLANSQAGGGFLKVRVRGSGGDRLARGAQVRVYDAGRLGEPAALRGFQSAGTGLPGSGVANLSELLFGVPAHGRFDVEARFLDGRKAVLRGAAAGSRLTLHALPWGVREADAAAHRVRRAALLANPWQEGALLAASLVLALSLRTRLARRAGAGRLCRGSIAPAFLLLAQGVGALAAIESLSGGARILSFAAPLTAAVLLVFADWLLAAWNERQRARHLGPYRLLELIGEGGMGAVWRARHLVSRREVALKVLQPLRTADEAHRLRFLREGAILARLDHPNIVRVYETGESDGRGYIAMERLAGDTLGARIRKGGPLPPAGAAALLAVAAEALGTAHRAGIVHRDVKADNFFVAGTEADLPLSLEGWRARLKLMDFGLAHSQEMLSLTAGDGLLGTLAYLAPEQLGGQPPSFRSDLYALGVVAFETATGRLPSSPDSALATLPEPLARLLARLLARDPAARPANAAEVAEAAAALLRETADTAPGAPSPSAGGSPTVRAPSSTERLWQGRFQEIRRSLDAGSVTEAQILLLALVADLRRRLEILPPDERSGYANRHRLHEVLDLERRLRTDHLEIR